MRNGQRSHAEALQELNELRAHLGPQPRVEIRHRLIQQQQRGPHGKCASDGDALLLTSRKLMRIASGEFAELHLRQCITDAVFDLGLRDAHHARPEAQVLRHRHMRKERVVLEHHADIALERRHAFHARPVEEDCAGARNDESGDGS